jgi:hypothetical protein
MEDERASGTPEFSYEALIERFGPAGKKAILVTGGYGAFILPGNRSFIGFQRGDDPEGQPSQEGHIFKEYGLKFHISLPEFNLEMYKKGWNIVRNTLFYHKVQSFKVIMPGKKMSDDLGQEGKDVTVYIDAEPSRTVEEWKIVLEDVTNRLAQEGISPGYRPPGTAAKPEKPIKGTNYVTYRYENKKEESWPEFDPCEVIAVICKYPQLEIPMLKRHESLEKIEHLKKPM